MLTCLVWSNMVVRINNTSIFRESGITCDSAIYRHSSASPRGVERLPSHKWRRSDGKPRYQILFRHRARKFTKFIQAWVCTRNKLLRKFLQISHYGMHGGIPLSQQPPKLCLGSHCNITMIPSFLKVENMPQRNTDKTKRYLCRT